jgi:hypothetical protein
VRGVRSVHFFPNRQAGGKSIPPYDVHMAHGVAS